MAGYWPSSFFAYLWTETKSGFRGNVSSGIQRVVPSGQDGSILPARVVNHIVRFGSSCPLAELAT